MIPWLNGFSATWFDWMASMLWQSAILIGIIWAADLLLRRFAWPQFRHMLWLLIFVKLLLPPGFALPTSIFPSGVEAVRQFMHRDIALPNPAPIEHQTVQLPIEDARTNPLPLPAHAASVSWQAHLMLAWLAGILLLTGCLWLRLRHLRPDRSQPELPEWFSTVLQQCAARVSIKRIPAVRITSALKCPAVFGIFRPTVLIPGECLELLDKKQLSDILIHEFMHIKRGDLSIHAAQIVLQILYWPNLLLWLLRRPMQDLRELCCDASAAAVLRENTHSYRQTLIDVARRLIAEPVNPGMGLLGLFEQPHAIVTRLRYLQKPYGRQTLCKFLSAVAALLMLISVLPMSPMRAQTGGPEKPSINAIKATPSTGDQEKPRFETISIKRAPYDAHYTSCDFLPGGRFKAHAPLGILISEAYGLDLYQVFSLPKSIEKAYWDIEAKPEEGKYPLKDGKLDRAAGKLMLQSMLEDRFSLKAHRETKVLPGYELVLAKGGSKLQPATGQTKKAGVGIMPGHVGGYDMPVSSFALVLERVLSLMEGEKERFHIADKTGLEGHFDIQLSWTPAKPTPWASNAEANGEADVPLFDALQNQLGLKLAPANIPVEAVVVDSIQAPARN